MVEKDCSNIIQMSIESEQAPPALIRPDFDLVVVSPRYEQWLGLVEIYASDRPVMLLEAIYQCAHTIIP